MMEKESFSNKCIKKAVHARVARSRAGIDDLPTEILMEILILSPPIPFRFYPYFTPYHSGFMWFFTLTAVCRRWRHIAWGTARLWNNLYWARDMTHPGNCIELQLQHLHRLTHVPIFFTIELSDEAALSTCRAIVIGLEGRVKGLIVDLSFETMVQYEDSWDSDDESIDNQHELDLYNRALTWINRFTGLERLHLYELSDLRPFLELPSFRRLTHVHVEMGPDDETAEKVAELDLPNLQSLNVEADYDFCVNLHQFFQNAPNLTELLLYVPRVQVLPDDSQTRATHRKLERLTIYDYDFTCDDFFHSVNLPALTHLAVFVLELDGIEKTVAPLLGRLRPLGRHLRRLTLLSDDLVPEFEELVERGFFDEINDASTFRKLKKGKATNLFNHAGRFQERKDQWHASECRENEGCCCEMRELDLKELMDDIQSVKVKFNIATLDFSEYHTATRIFRESKASWFDNSHTPGW
ncbi:hypothetical protein CONPUDRAFT_142796 [Coniophora puteana RWD-64-598 SS2]|uniref:Uncharacterized protein n=1 Tax=Coniophora puteana (strain RWD-64-598) TaxID=741705 RepID=A0A5M3MZK3_CONPW|nr:uncharacterized protein CONPUDRAFT_142796 [Coniophora puteana RWD-64-598 SS2]EIW84572.1 hypothetical protein CONPUDRAFT_142796 [Coniophora puteana RWD-64-598 SS2]